MTIISQDESPLPPGRRCFEDYLATARLRYIAEAGKNFHERRRRLTGAALLELMTFHAWRINEAVAILGGVSLTTARKHVGQYKAWLRENYDVRGGGLAPDQ